MTTTYNEGDLVRLNGRQTSTLTVLSAPIPGGEDYTVELPINDAPKSFTYSAPDTDTISDVASGLEAVLLNEQTHYSVAVGSPSWMLVLVGPPGESFDVGTPTGNLQAAVFEEAVESAVERPVRVLKSREVWTRSTLTREMERIEQLTGRELETAEPFGFSAADVREDVGPERYS